MGVRATLGKRQTARISETNSGDRSGVKSFMRHACLLVCLIVSAAAAGACASAPINKSATVDLARADILVTEGCYDCLSEARDIYARVAVAKARPIVLPRLFETTVLLGLREKELALDPAKRLEAARTPIPELPATYSAAAYLDMASAVLPDAFGTSRRRLGTIRRPAPGVYIDWQHSLEAGAGGALFRRYLSLSLDCGFGAQLGLRVAPPAGAQAATVRAPGAAAAPPVSTWAGMPDASTDPPGNLLAYRRANCGRSDRVMLSGLAEGDERFVEAGVIANRTRSIAPTSKEIANALTWLTAAAVKWPASPTVTFALGSLHQYRGDCRAAQSFYEKTLAIEPMHEPAQLGRLTCLSYLKQHADAIAQATAMIRDAVEEGESRYWRAWNLRETGKLVEARADSDRAKQILYNDRILTLAGQIEHDQDDLGVAEKDLADATRLNPNNCIAPWYGALVQLKRQAWPATAAGFVKAMGCYESAVAYDREKLEEMKKAENVDEVFRASQIVGFEAAIKDDSSQVSASALNAAVNFARANNREKALEYCDLAAKDPDRAKQVADLRALIVK